MSILFGKILPEKSLGENVRHYRERARLSQATLAERVGVSEGTISKWERAEQGMTAENLQAVAMALEVTANDLLPGNDSRPSRESAADAVIRAAAERDAAALREAFELLVSPAIRRLWDSSSAG